MNTDNPLLPFSHLFRHEKDQKSPKFVKEIFTLLGHYSDRFLKKRASHYLFKIAKTLHLLSKQFEEALPTEEERCVFMKFLAVKFKEEPHPRKALGIALCFNFFYSRENFDQSHLLKVLQKLIPGIHILDGSFYSCNVFRQNKLICYCEIEKIRGKNLSFQDCLYLKRNLVQEVKDGIELLSPHLCVTDNEEEIFKNILCLQREVTSSKDVPHIIISFLGQNEETVRFGVVLVRIIPVEDASVKQLLSKLSIDIQFHTYNTSLLEDDHIKETSVFFIKVKSSLFYRKNYAIDLLKARQYISMLLEQVLGEFRDYNGGLLIKQTEQFDSIKKDLMRHFGDISSFEEFFYSFTPSNIQLLITFEIALELCEAFYDLKSTPLKKPHDTRTSHSGDIFFILIKSDSPIYDSIFLNLPSDSLIATSSMVIDRKKYQCLIQVNPSNLLLTHHVEDRLIRLEKKEQTLSKKEFRTAFEFSPPSFHPHLTTDIRSLTLCKALYEGLTRIAPNEEVELALAKDMTISSCKTIYTFTLRPSRWSNGEELTSYHFAKAWKRAISSSSNCIRVKNFFLIKNAKKIHQGLLPLEKAGIHTPSKEKIVIELQYPAPYLPQLLADPIYSPLYSERVQEPTIFNGPFILSSNKQEQIRFTRNSVYWDVKSVDLEKITIFLIQDSQKAYQMYKKEDLDFIGSPLSALPKQAIKESEEIQSYEPSFPFWLFCNTKNQKLGSTKVRQALSYAIDRKKLLEQLPPFQKSSCSIIPEKLSFLDPKDFFPENALEKAVSLFEEGLKELGINRKEFELNFSHSNVPEHKKLSQFIKNTWESVFNIKVNLTEESWNAYWNTVFNRDYEIAGFFSYATYEEYMRFMDFFECSSNNYITWENSCYQRYLNLARFSENENEKKKLLQTAEMILNREMPVIPLYNHVPLYLKKSFVNNFTLSKFSYIDFKWIRFND